MRQYFWGRLLALVVTPFSLLVISSGTLAYNPNPYLIGANSTIYSVAEQPDGKIIIGGTFSSVNNVSHPRIARYNADDSLDAGFTSNIVGNVFKVVVDDSGHILVGGSISSVNGTPRTKLSRLNSDGTLDMTFNPSFAGGDVHAITLQQNGKILVGGNFSAVNGSLSPKIVRLNSDGGTDASFSIGTGAAGTVFDIAVQDDRKIIAAGSFSAFNGQTHANIVRLKPNGSIDADFVATGSNSTIQTIAIQKDSKILLGGGFTQFNAASAIRIVRLLPDGTIDMGFSARTSGYNSTITRIKVQENGRIMVAGSYTQPSPTKTYHRLSRLLQNGALDQTFGGGSSYNSTVHDLTFQGKDMVVVGSFTQHYSAGGTNRIIRVNRKNQNLNYIGLYNINANDRVSAIAVPTDGNFILGGRFTTMFISNTPQRLVRIAHNGHKDSTFNPPGTNGEVLALGVQPDGKIIAGGAFSQFGTTSVGNIVRMTTSGARDTAFVATTNGEIRGIAIQADGKIIIAGNFGVVNGVAKARIARLNSDGTLDNTFVATGPNSALLDTVQLQADGKILVGGGFTQFNGVSSPNIARLNADGSIDNSFAVDGTGPNDKVTGIAVLPDRQILISGNFTSVNGLTISGVAKLEADGSLVQSFTPTTLGRVFSLATQSDGKIIIGGEFVNVNGSTVSRRLARLNPDGSLDDANFKPVSFQAPNFSVISTVIHADGTLLFGGDFTQVNGINLTRFARLGMVSESPMITLTPSSSGNSLTIKRTGGGPVFNWVTLDSSIDNVTWNRVGEGQRDNKNNWLFNGTNIPLEESRYFRVEASYGNGKSGNGSMFRAVYEIYRKPSQDCSFFIIKAANGKQTVVCL